MFYSPLSSVVGQARRQHLQLQLLSEHHPVPPGTRRLVPVFEMKSFTLFFQLLCLLLFYMMSELLQEQR